MVAIATQVGNIPKSKYNKAQDYWYATEVDIIRALRPLLASASIYIHFSVVDVQTVIRPEGAGKSLLTQAQVDYTIYGSGEQLSGTAFGYGMDTGDKGIYKAITGAKKYALMLLFLIDTGDDPEADEKVDRPPVIVNTREGPGFQGDEPDLSGIPDEAWDQIPQPTPVVAQTHRTDIVRGGHTTGATETQLDRLRASCVAMGVDTDDLRVLIEEMFQVDQLTNIGQYLREVISPAEMGLLIRRVEEAAP